MTGILILIGLRGSINDASQKGTLKRALLPRNKSNIKLSGKKLSHFL